MHTRPVVTGPVKQAISLRLAPHRGVPEFVCSGLETSVEIVAVIYVFIAVGVIFRVGENKVRQQTCRRFMLELINTPFTFYSLSPLQPAPVVAGASLREINREMSDP